MKRPAPNRLICRIEMSAFSAILWVLLFTFLASSPAVCPQQNHWLINVNHSTSQPKALREDSLHVGVVRDSRIFFGSVIVSPDQLVDGIREGVRKGAERKVYIYADGRAPYAVVRQVLEAVAQARIENVAFITDVHDNY